MTVAAAPSLAVVGRLVGDPARAGVLTVLLDGRALSATELASVAGVGKSTISVHLDKLRRGGLVAMERQGRHRYFRLAHAGVARALEALLGLAAHPGAPGLRTGPSDPALRKARVCYDHLAGTLGVLVYDRLVAARAFTPPRLEGGGLGLSPRGRRLFAGLGVDVEALLRERRALARPCLDWSERRPHLAGALGEALLARVTSLRWARRRPPSRALHFTAAGEAALRRALERA